MEMVSLFVVAINNIRCIKKNENEKKNINEVN